MHQCHDITFEHMMCISIRICIQHQVDADDRGQLIGSLWWSV